MRVTHSMLSREAIKNINSNYERMLKSQVRVTKGKRIQSPSEDPGIASKSMNLRSQDNRISQYAKNIDAAVGLISSTETSLREINNTIQDIQGLISQAATSTVSQDQREGICTEIEQYRERILYALNTEGTGGYLFGGYNTNKPPLEYQSGVVTYNGIDLQTMTDPQFSDLSDEITFISISKGIAIDATMTALDVIGKGPENMLTTIDNIITELKRDPVDHTALKIQTDLLDGRFDDVLVKISEMGGKTRRLDLSNDMNDTASLNIKELLSKTENMDFEEAVIKYAMAEQAYKAALSVSSKIVQTTLLDYIK